VINLSLSLSLSLSRSLALSCRPRRPARLPGGGQHLHTTRLAACVCFIRVEPFIKISPDATSRAATRRDSSVACTSVSYVGPPHRNKERRRCASTRGTSDSVCEFGCVIRQRRRRTQASRVEWSGVEKLDEIFDERKGDSRCGRRSAINRAHGRTG